MRKVNQQNKAVFKNNHISETEIKKNLNQAKSQAAMEFLLTYGWALLVVLIVGVALFFYFGNPYMFFPNRIDFGQGIHVPDFTYGYLDFLDYKVGSFEIIIRNNLGETMRDATLTIDQCNNGLGNTSDKFTIQPGQSYHLVFNCEDIATNVNSMNKFNGTLEFHTRINNQDLNHRRRAEIIVNAQDLIKFSDNNRGRMLWALRNGASGQNDENRFYPCDDVPGCINTDDSGVLKMIFGGYIDSKTGIVWDDESDEKELIWSIKIGDRWDTIHFTWDYNEKKYVRSEEGSLALRNDIIGSAFTYCTDLNKNSKSDWKLASAENFEGLLKCNQCLPPFGKYETSKELGNLKRYWTENPSQQDGFSICINFVEDYDSLKANCRRDLYEFPVRCVRDNP